MKRFAASEFARCSCSLGEEEEEILTIDDMQNAIAHCDGEGITPDLIESMLFRSWIRMLVVIRHV